MLFISAPDSQLSAVDSLIDSMMLVENGNDNKQNGDDDEQNGDDDKKKDIFKVHNIPNPAFQRLFQVLHTSLSGVETPLCLLNLIYQLSFFSKQHKLQVSDDESPTTLVLLKLTSSCQPNSSFSVYTIGRSTPALLFLLWRSG